MEASLGDFPFYVCRWGIPEKGFLLTPYSQPSSRDSPQAPFGHTVPGPLPGLRSPDLRGPGRGELSREGYRGEEPRLRTQSPVAACLRDALAQRLWPRLVAECHPPGTAGTHGE